MTWREHLADRLTGGALTAARTDAEGARLAAAGLRHSRDEAMARLKQTLAADPSRARYVRATVLIGAILHRFQRDAGREAMVATAGHALIDHWCSIHDELTRTVPGDDDDEPAADQPVEAVAADA